MRCATRRSTGSPASSFRIAILTAGKKYGTIPVDLQICIMLRITIKSFNPFHSAKKAECGPRAFCRIRNRTCQAWGPNPDDLFMKKSSDVDLDPYGSALILGRLNPIRIRIQVGKNDTESEEMYLLFWNVGFRLLRREGFFCSLDVLHGVLGINIMQFFSAVHFYNFCVTLRSGSRSESALT